MSLPTRPAHLGCLGDQARYDQARCDRGAQVLAAFDRDIGQQVVDALADIASLLAHHVSRWASAISTPARARRPAAPPRHYRDAHRSRRLRAAARSAHQRALNVGLSPVEIVEATSHASVYCGFPKALNAMFVAKRVPGERGLLPVRSPAG